MKSPLFGSGLPDLVDRRQRAGLHRLEHPVDGLLTRYYYGDMARKGKLFTDQFRDAIRNSGMKPYRLAQLSGVHREILSRFLNGKTGMSLGSVDAIFETLNLRIESPDREPEKERSQKA